METTKLKELWEKVKLFFKNMSTKVRIILCAVLVLIIAGIIALAVLSGGSPYTVLWTDLSATEINDIRSFMLENGYTDYQLTEDTLSVPEEDANAIMAQLVLAGYPRDGYMFETYFEKVGMTTTNSERNDILEIALEERLAAVIRNFPGVRAAWVDIAMGQDRTYVLQDVQTATTASVTLEMASGQMLTDGQAASIRNMISHSVRDLAIEDVSIQDTVGNSYMDDHLTDISDTSEVKLALEQYYRNSIRTEVVNLLTPIYGPDNVSVMVSCTVDVNRRVQESLSYSQPEGSADNAGLIGKETVLGIVTADGVEVVGGIPGTTTNSDLDIPTYMEDLLQGNGETPAAEWYRDVEHRINETNEQIEVIAGSLTDLQISITINRDSPNGGEVKALELRNHVATGAGIGGEKPENRVSVLIAPFYTDGSDELLPSVSQLSLPLIIVGVALLVVVLILILVLLSIKKKKKKQEQEEEQEALDAGLGPIGSEETLFGEPGEQQAPVTGADIMELNTEKSMELRKTVRQFAQNNPEIAAQMIKDWLKGGEDDNGR